MNELSLRLLVFVGLLIVLVALEYAIPRRLLVDKKANRWVANLTLAATGIALVRLLLPVSIVGFALYAETSWNKGLFHVLAWPNSLEILLSIIALDFIIYAQHVAFHKAPTLWRLHKVHHTDLDVDASTAVRFHPLEILLSALIKIAAVILLGISATSVIAFEIILSSMALFNHSNIFLPPRLDKMLRFFVVTPDMHHIHHSVISAETDSNYGFNLSVWDRIFKTYTQASIKPYNSIPLGLSQYRNRLSSYQLFLLPFGRKNG